MGRAPKLVAAIAEGAVSWDGGSGAGHEEPQTFEERANDGADRNGGIQIYGDEHPDDGGHGELPFPVCLGALGRQDRLNGRGGNGGMERIHGQRLAEGAVIRHLTYHVAQSGASCGDYRCQHSIVCQRRHHSLFERYCA